MINTICADNSVPYQKQYKTMKYYIYKLTNEVNDLCYIGQTKAPQYRFARCQYRAKKIADAIRQIGWPKFHAEIIAETDTKTRADELELFFIKKFDSVNHGYNSTYNTGYVGNAHRKESSRAMQREAMSKKVWFFNPETGETFRLSFGEAIPKGFVKGRGAWKPTNPYGARTRTTERVVAEIA